MPDPAAIVTCDHCGRDSKLGKYIKAKRQAEERDRAKAANDRRRREREKAKEAERAWADADRKDRLQANEAWRAEMQQRAEYSAQFSIGGVVAVFLALGGIAWAFVSSLGGVFFAVIYSGLLVSEHVRENTNAVHKLRKSVDEAIKKFSDEG